MKGDYQISRGDLFLTFSSKPFYIQNLDNLQYIYISFVELRVSGLYERLHISEHEPVYIELSFLREKWIDDFENSNAYFSDAQYFSRVFKKELNISPKQSIIRIA